MLEELEASSGTTRIVLRLEFDTEEAMSSPLKNSILRRAQQPLDQLAADVEAVSQAAHDTDSSVRAVLGISEANGSAQLAVSCPGGLPESDTFNRLLYTFHQSLAGTIEAAVRFDRSTRNLVEDIAAGRITEEDLPRRLEENRAIQRANYS